MSDKLYNVGIYIRLSRENTEYAGNESLSIENQQIMLSKFIAIMPGWVEKRLYIDNGASGGNFNRQGFQDMMRDVRNGIINLVLVQDLSRFGRNYLESGKYLEEELPALGCRFVALADGIDTEDGENDIMPFLNAMNDFYLKNLSDKIKDVFLAKAKAGHKLTGTPPYGYMRSPDDNRRLIVDEYAAEVIRKIFTMRAEGFGYSKIVGTLNAEKIPPPRLYYYQRLNRVPPDNCAEVWQMHAMRHLVVDEVYLGHTNSFKVSRNYRSAKSRRRKKDHWLQIKDTHEAIISQDLWDKAQEVNARNTKKWTENARTPQACLFTRKVYCADCNRAMRYFSLKVYKMDDRRKNYYRCATYAATGKQSCSLHSIGEEILKKIVLENIKEQADQLKLNEKSMVSNLLKKLAGDYAIERADSTKNLQKLKLELHQLDVKLEQLYEDKIIGTISAETFSQLAEKTERQRTEIAGQVERLEQNKETAKAKHNDIQNWVRLVKENSTLQDVDRTLLETLIERVEIGEKRVENGVKVQDVRIFYKFVGMV